MFVDKLHITPHFSIRKSDREVFRDYCSELPITEIASDESYIPGEGNNQSQPPYLFVINDATPQMTAELLSIITRLDLQHILVELQDQKREGSRGNTQMSWGVSQRSWEPCEFLYNINLPKVTFPPVTLSSYPIDRFEHATQVMTYMREWHPSIKFLDRAMEVNKLCNEFRRVTIKERLCQNNPQFDAMTVGVAEVLNPASGKSLLCHVDLGNATNPGHTLQLCINMDVFSFHACQMKKPISIRIFQANYDNPCVHFGRDQGWQRVV